jgi:DNA-binding phage protein
MAARKYAPPRSWVRGDGEWPAGPFVEDAPPYALVTAAVVERYLSVVGERSLRSVARAAGIDPTSLGRTLSGETVPDVHTVAVLEVALDTELWPRYPDRSAPATP